MRQLDESCPLFQERPCSWSMGVENLGGFRGIVSFEAWGVRRSAGAGNRILIMLLHTSSYECLPDSRARAPWNHQVMLPAQNCCTASCGMLVVLKQASTEDAASRSSACSRHSRAAAAITPQQAMDAAQVFSCTRMDQMCPTLIHCPDEEADDSVNGIHAAPVGAQAATSCRWETLAQTK